jgi:glycine cleavage system regulatory protein
MRMPTKSEADFAHLWRIGLTSRFPSKKRSRHFRRGVLARLAGEFAGIVRVEAPAARVAALTASLRELETQGLRVTIAASHADEEVKRAGVKLELLCLDRPGIVSEVTAAISSLGVNIEEFESGLVEAAFTGQPMFMATLRLHAPQTLVRDELRRRMEKLASEMIADIVLTGEQ